MNEMDSLIKSIYGPDMRDMFACYALQGLISSGHLTWPNNAAERAYEYADEMIKARKKVTQE